MYRTFAMLVLSSGLFLAQPQPPGIAVRVPNGYQPNPYTGVPVPAPIPPNAMTGAGRGQPQMPNPFTGSRAGPQRNPLTGQPLPANSAPNAWTRPAHSPASVQGAMQMAGLPGPEMPITGEAGPGLQAFDKVILDIMNRHGIPGASLAVAKEGRLVLARGYGWADLSTGEKIQPTTLFGLASVSKPLTATAIFKLIDERKLGLDDKAFAVLNHIKPPPGSRPDPRLQQITIRHLLNHSAGWTRTITGDPLNWAPKIAQRFRVPMPITPEHLIAYMYLVPLNFNPGTQWQYSNVGYVMLGEIIAKVSGQSYQDYIRTQILKPMGVHRTELTGTRRSYAPDEAHSYLPGNGVQLPPLDMPWSAGASGWSISTVDLVRFLTAYDGSRGGKAFLSDRSRKDMIALPPPPLRPRADGTHAGLGWPIATLSGDSYSYMHDGMWNGMRVFMKRTTRGVNWALAFNVSFQPDVTDHQVIKAIVEEVRAEVERIEKFPDIDLFKKYAAQ